MGSFFSIIHREITQHSTSDDETVLRTVYFRETHFRNGTHSGADIAPKGQAETSGRMSIRRICAATPNSDPSSSTRTIVAWQHTQHFSPEVSSGGRIKTSSTSAPFSMRDLV